ncbi:MAG: efflux RND transporter periplasmic adaptor subunit [Minisyncoccia bacterium]|jgi:HlyD family secretion protein
MNETTFLKRVWGFIRKHWILSALAVIIIIILVLVLSGGKKAVSDTVTVARGNISEEVSATGNVKPVHSVDLAFEKSGRIAAVNADVGNKVYAGEAVVVLDRADLNAQLSKAEADLDTQNASLNKASVDLQNDYGSVPNILNDAYIKSDDAVRVKTSSLFNGSGSSGYQVTYNSCDAQTTIDATSLKLKSEAELIAWQKELAGMSGGASAETLKQLVSNAEGHLTVFKKFLERTNDGLTAGCVAGNANYDTARANVTTARNNVSAALTSVTNQEQIISSQEATVGSLSSGINSYQAGIEDIKAQLAKTAIYAPISGVVTVQNAKVGEIAPAGTVMVSIISASNFEVEANVPEADIAKVKVGDDAAVTLDAYGSDVIFDTKVSSVDPAETMVEGIATYKTKFQFTKMDDRVKSGMTANITVFTAKRENVLVIPQRLVMTKDGKSSVMVDLGNGRSEERTVEAGLKGVDGNVEIVSGLNEGDKVIVNSNI